MFSLSSLDWPMVEEGKWKVSLEIGTRFEGEGLQQHFHTGCPVPRPASEPVIPVIN